MEKEIRDVVGFPGYKISNYGEVYSLWEGRGYMSSIGNHLKRLKTSLDENGREVVRLSKDKKRINTKVCWLVLEAFHGPRPKGMQACHFPDRDPSNNRADNLRWDTPSSNYNDRIFHHTCNRGTRNGSNKLSESQVIDIRKKRKLGRKYRELSEEYNVSISNIQQICERRKWKWL